MKTWCVCVMIAGVCAMTACQSSPKATPQGDPSQKTVVQGSQSSKAGPTEVAKAWAASGMPTAALAVDPGVKAQVETWARGQKDLSAMQVIRAWEAGRGEWTVILGPNPEPAQGEQVMEVGVALVGGSWAVNSAKVSEGTVGWPEL